MLGGIAFSVYEWLKCAFARHSFLIVEGSIDKMKNIHPLNSRFTLPFAFVLAVSLLAVSLLFMLPGGPLHAQTDAMEYPENGTGPVATFTAIDPEGASIMWTLAGADMADFDIENGVLSFKSPPDFESPGSSTTSNTYQVTVQVSDGGLNTTAMEEVTIEVIDVEEPGTVTLSTLQPQVGVAITATLTDPDGTVSNATWQWYRGNIEIVGAITAPYTPVAGDVGSVLRATAMYDDTEGEDKTAHEDSAHAVRQAPESNIPPTFPNQDPGPGGTATTDQTREVAENTPAGTNIGAPVAASDTDVLTYSLDATGQAAFDINRATGQLITKVALNHEGTGSYTAIMVKATDPFGAEIDAMVTITVTDVNEAPSVTGGAASIDRVEGDTALQVDDSPAQYTATDADEGDEVGLKWSLSGADASKFSISPTTGVTSTLSFEEAPDYESPGDSDGNNVYEVTLVVTDSKSNSDEQDVTVKVTNMGETGTVILSTLQPRVGFPVTATLTDPDNITADSVSWQWYDGAIIENNLTDNAIEDATSATYTPTMDDIDDTLTARATYTDGHTVDPEVDDVATGPAESVVLADTRNNAPVFEDQDDEMEGRQTAQERTVDENTDAGESIGAVVEATDEDMNLTYSLGGPDAASFDIVRTSGELQTKAELDKETKDTYTVTVTATDSLGASSTITVTIKVNNVDEMPDLEGEVPEEYAENGTRPVATFTAVDPEGESIVWSLVGTDNADFSIDNGVLRFKSPPDFEDTGRTDQMYVVTVQASDGGQDTTATEEVTIEVTNVEEPGTVTLSTLQPQVGVEITATLDDPDNETAGTVTWQWYRGSSPIVNATDGADTTESDYIPTTGDNRSVLRATAMYDDDEGEDKTAQINSYRSVRAAPATNNVPVFPELSTPGNQTRAVAENTPAGTNLGAPIAANDPGDLLTYSLSGNDSALFSITRATGQLSTKADLDYEATGNPSNDEFAVTVTATDPFGAADMANVTITITDVNESPSVMGAASIDHAENGTVLDVDAADQSANPANYIVSDPDGDDPQDELEVTLRGNDRDKFSIENGLLAFKEAEAPDYESPGDSDGNNVYEVTVRVTDSDDNTGEQDVTVKVTNVEEDGEVTLSTLQPRVGFPVTVTLTDPDNITADSVSWQWYRGTASLGSLPEECTETTLNNCAIKGATSDTYTPVADDVQNLLTAVATYTDGSPNDPDVNDGKDVVLEPAAQQVLADTRNKAPVFEDQDDEMEGRQTAQERMVDENTDTEQPIGVAVIAMDFTTMIDGTMPLEKLTYSLGGPDAASFSIDRGTAQLTTKTALDYETKNTYTVTVTATDPSGETATATVTITVTDEDEAPIIMIGGLTISGPSNMDYAENGTDAVATYMVSGPDAASAMWTLEGDDAAAFDITDGALTFKASPDYEMPADADTDNTYMVTVKADDGTYTDTHEVIIRVTDEDEAPPVIIDISISGQTDHEYPENGTDAVDAYTLLLGRNEDSATWSLEGPDFGAFAINRIGVLTFNDSPDYENPTDANSDNIYMVTVTAVDMDNMNNMDTHEVTVTVTNVDEVPSIAGDATIEYAENDTGDVATYTAMDPEETAISWSLSGIDAGVFDISAAGMLTFKESPDYEMPADADTDNTYMVTLNAAGGTYDVTIMVIDVDEVPTIEGDATIDYAENGTGDVATFTAMDPEETAISWSLAGDDADVFDIAGGVLTFKESPDYEMPADADTDNVYMVTVKASDGTNMAIQVVTVTVTNEDDTTVGEDLLDRYDDDDSGHIDRAEAVRAVLDYQGGQLTRAEAVQVILLYQAGPQ